LHGCFPHGPDDAQLPTPPLSSPRTILQPIISSVAFSDDATFSFAAAAATCSQCGFGADGHHTPSMGV
jgi:hypothetical protein